MPSDIPNNTLEGNSVDIQSKLEDVSISSFQEISIEAPKKSISIDAYENVSMMATTNNVTLSANNCINMETSKKSINLSAPNGQINSVAKKDSNVTSTNGTVNVRSYTGELNTTSYNDTTIISIAGNVNIRSKGNVSIVSSGDVVMTPGPNNQVSVNGEFTATSIIQGPPGTTSDTLLVPSGVMMQYAGQSSPNGWFLCDGSSYEISTYLDLYKVIGTMYGGSGGYFSVPDMRGRVGIGASSSAINGLSTAKTLATSSGEETHTLTIDEMPSHTHDVENVLEHNGDTYPALGFDPRALGREVSKTTDAAGSGLAHNNMQPYLVLNYIIKY